MGTSGCVSLKHAPKEMRIEKISGEGGSPGAARVALSWELNMWDEDFSLLTLCDLGQAIESQIGLG